MKQPTYKTTIDIKILYTIQEHKPYAYGLSSLCLTTLRPFKVPIYPYNSFTHVLDSYIHPSYVKYRLADPVNCVFVYETELNKCVYPSSPHPDSIGRIAVILATIKRASNRQLPHHTALYGTLALLAP